MTKFLLSAIILFFGLSILAQDPVSWTFEYQKKDDSNGSIIMTAQMDQGWVIYSQHTDEGGPIPTNFDWHASPDFTYVGQVDELSKAIKGFSEMFELNVIKFKNEAIFEQKIQNVKNGAIIKGSVTYMSCSGNKCLPPKKSALK